MVTCRKISEPWL